MKKIIAILAIVASAQAAAFWDSSNGSGSGAYNGAGDFVGNGTAEGEATFSMDFKGRGRTDGDFRGNADTNGNFSGYGYESYPYWGGYQPYGMAPQVPVAPVQAAE